MKTTDKIIIGQRIRAARKQRGYSQMKLANLVGISNRTISMYETGNSSPDIETANRLANALETSLSAIFAIKAVESEPPKDH